MTGAGATALVAGREINEALRRKSFWIIAAIILVGATAAMIVPELIDDDSDTTYQAIIVGDQPGLRDSLRAVGDQLDVKIEVENVQEISTARHRVEEGEADVGLVGGDDPSVIVSKGENDTMVGAARQAMVSVALAQRLESAGLDQAQIREAMRGDAPRLDEVDEESSGRRATALVISFVLYLLLLTLMIQVANGVAVEKSNRISEVLLAIVRPGPLLFGKVLGVGVVGLATLAAAAIPVVIKIVVGGDLPEGIAGAVAGSALWFLLGLALYLTISGALGALVERQEQAGSAVAPLTFILIGTFVFAQSGIDTPLGTVLAYFPLTSPLIVPTRLAMGVSSPVELIGSLIILVATTALAARVAAVIYSRAIVRTGRRLTLREVWSGT